ncbi:Crp/Fnr family transcriptional regulator [Massilia oculi]|uniref:Crp/Fnr family transcriptional regulator n=1 Tax=Massilia hydrophila TaxID=3044279 RepID=A0ABS7YAH3_9BURK|nr:Crp/Fnr family transcriptional regulator [Massilia oculi]MCA1855544.1 Crp/Fnr family transcriptional regulator [Massilia oculi]
MSRPHIDPRQFLKRLPLFADLSSEQLDMVAAATTELHVPRSQVIFKRGDPCHGFHTVIYGNVKLCFVSSQGDEKVIELVGAGQSFGEALMFMDRDYIVQAETLADCMLLHIGKAAIYNEIERNPSFSRRMLAGMSRRLHGLISDVEALSLRSGSQRIVGYLLKDEPEEGGEITLAVSKKMIASRLNLTPEYFSRVLHDMADRGMVNVAGRTIRILDIERLRAYEG